MGREAVSKLTERQYKDRLLRSGRLPTGKEQREMEVKSQRAAEKVDRDRKRR